MAAEQLKLTIELVPSTVRYSNLYAFYKSMSKAYKAGIKKSEILGLIKTGEGLNEGLSEGLNGS